MIEAYESMKYLRDRLKLAHPDLMVDFSFEVFGTEQPSISALQYSELHHASNMNTKEGSPISAREIRVAAYRFCDKLPVERIMHSLICVQGSHAVENLLTAMIGAPLTAGDLRTLDSGTKETIRAVVGSYRKLADRGAMTSFAQLRETHCVTRNEWDGFVRFADQGHGYACLFRNEGDETAVFGRKNMGLSTSPVLVDALSGERFEADGEGLYRIDWPRERAWRYLTF